MGLDLRAWHLLPNTAQNHLLSFRTFGAVSQLLPLTHEFPAEMLGVQRSTVSVVARTLQTAGLTRQNRGGITVVDRAGLEETACECYGKIRRIHRALGWRSDWMIRATFPGTSCSRRRNARIRMALPLSIVDPGQNDPPVLKPPPPNEPLVPNPPGCGKGIPPPKPESQGLGP